MEKNAQKVLHLYRSTHLNTLVQEQRYPTEKEAPCGTNADDRYNSLSN